MSDPLVALAFFMLGLGIYGLGFTAGRNHAKREWRRWLKRQVSRDS
jgi:hypothetical protein